MYIRWGIFAAFSALLAFISACGFDQVVVSNLDPETDTLKPVAVITFNSPVQTRINVTLSGTGSHDPKDESLTFEWVLAETPNGSLAALSDATTAVTTFFADKGGYYTATLKVTNASGTASDVSTARIETIGSGGNHPPVAIITKTVSGGVAILDGSGSYDIDGGSISYRWDIVNSSGGSAVLSTNTDIVTTLRSNDNANFVVKLQVSDGIDTDDAYETVSTTP